MKSHFDILDFCLAIFFFTILASGGVSFVGNLNTADNTQASLVSGSVLLSANYQNYSEGEYGGAKTKIYGNTGSANGNVGVPQSGTSAKSDSVSVTTSTTTVGKSLICGSLGDVNGDGVISQADRDLILAFTRGTVTPTDVQRKVADVNGNGDVSTLDSTFIGEYLTGARSTFPGCMATKKSNSASVPIDSVRGSGERKSIATTSLPSLATTTLFGTVITTATTTSFGIATTTTATTTPSFFDRARLALGTVAKAVNDKVNTLISFFGGNATTTATTTTNTVVRKSLLPSAPKIPVRGFVLDTLGKPSTLIETATGTFIDSSGKEWTDSKGTLTDTATGQVWDIEYEKKGHSRAKCHPPVLNLSFDKKTKKGKQKPLFVGRSTYENSSNLSYQKIRLIPECDVFDDGWSNRGLGFANSVNLLLRESVIYAIARKEFGLPVVDIAAITELTIKAPDTDASKSYRYMFLQRDNEKDDQVSFATQFGLFPELIEASDAEESNPKKTIVPLSIINDGITSITYTDIASGENKRILMDPENAIRIRLLYEFVHMNDHHSGWNEDYGIDAQNGLGKIIPYDFDLALQCRLDSPQYVTSVIQGVPPEKRATYKAILAKVSREIFGDAASLDGMFQSVDRFPFPVDKTKLKAFLRIQFYNFAAYFGSESFAKDMGVPYVTFPIATSLPSEAERGKLRNDFLVSCGRPPASDFSKGHVFTILPNPTLTTRTIKNGQNTEQSLAANFKVEITAGSEALKIHQNQSFEVQLQTVAGVPKGSNVTLHTAYVSPDTNLVFEKPFYVIPAGKKAVFTFFAELSAHETSLLQKGGAYQAFISKIRLGSESFITPNPVFSNAVTFGYSITILSPNEKETKEWVKGQSYTIRWNTPAPTVMIGLIAPGREFPITENDIPNTGSFTYTVPSSIFAGSGYQVKISHRENALPKVSELSSVFSVREPPEAKLFMTPVTATSPDVSGFMPGDKVVILGRGFKPSATIMEARLTTSPFALFLYTFLGTDIMTSKIGNQFITIPIPKEDTLGRPLAPGRYSLQVFDTQTADESNVIFLNILSPVQKN